jgi:hypothetical protein
MLVSLDGGATYCEAPEGVRVVVGGGLILFESSDCDLLINLTEEGMVMDLWQCDANLDPEVCIGTDSETYCEIAERLKEQA